MLRVIQTSLHLSRAVAVSICKLLASGRIEVALIQEPWIVEGRVGV